MEINEFVKSIDLAKKPSRVIETTTERNWRVVYDG